MECKIEKVLTGNDQQYSIQIEINEFGKVELITKFAGLQSMQNIIENYELTLEIADSNQYRYNYNNNVEFIESSNIEYFTDSNTLRLDTMEEEQRNTFINAVVERIQNVNKNQMEKIGMNENENPLQYFIPELYNVVELNSSDNANLSEEEVSTFNLKFENYESTNLKGVTVKGLLSTIQLNNETQESQNRKIKEIHFDGQEYEVTDQNIAFLKDSVELETEYRVEFERDEETGMIYRAVINKK